MQKILLVDDDIHMLGMVEQILDQEGYSVFKARSGMEALRVAESEQLDLCILDVGMPQMDGVTLCRNLRAMPEMSDTPIIFLTGHNTTYSVSDALEAGGDDYVRKPFAVRELAARIRAHLRRAKQQDNLPVLQITTKTYQVFLNQREVQVTRIEFDLLRFLCSNPGHWYTTQDLLENVWQYPNGIGDTALVRNHIRNVRRKIEENPDKPAIIQSRNRRGYAVRAAVQMS